jgi:hypothetical protein
LIFSWRHHSTQTVPPTLEDHDEHDAGLPAIRPSIFRRCALALTRVLRQTLRQLARLALLATKALAITTGLLLLGYVLSTPAAWTIALTITSTPAIAVINFLGDNITPLPIWEEAAELLLSGQYTAHLLSLLSVSTITFYLHREKRLADLLLCLLALGALLFLATILLDSASRMPATIVSTTLTAIRQWWHGFAPAPSISEEQFPTLRRLGW